MILAGSLLIPDQLILACAIFLIATLVVVRVAERKTEGGWRYRDGSED